MTQEELGRHGLRILVDIPHFYGLSQVLAERERQQKEEGFDDAKDDLNVNGEMAVVAACYAVEGLTQHAFGSTYDLQVHATYGIKNHNLCDCGRSDCHDVWPWDPKWDKRKVHPRIKQLAIAGALILAELDRLHRLELNQPWTTVPLVKHPGEPMLELRQAQTVFDVFKDATTHQELVELVWAARAIIGEDGEAAPFWDPISQAKSTVYQKALSLYFVNAERVLGRPPMPVEVDEIECGFAGHQGKYQPGEGLTLGRQVLREKFGLVVER